MKCCRAVARFTARPVVDTMTAILKDDPVDLPLAERHIPPALAHRRSLPREKPCGEVSVDARSWIRARRTVVPQRDHGCGDSGRQPSIVLVESARRVARRRDVRHRMSRRARTCGRRVLVAASVDSPELRLQLHAPGIDIPGGGLTSFALSPDGRQFVFIGRDGNRPALWLRSLTPISHDPWLGTDGGRDPFWSQDSRSVGFFANGQLKRVDLADGLVRTLTSAPNAAGGAWNSEGTILFTISFAGPIYKIPAGGGEAAAVTRTAPPAHSGHVFPEVSAGRAPVCVFCVWFS